MINATIAVIINIILNIILSRYLGIGGLALATSIAAIVGTILLFISFRKKVGAFGMRNISSSFVKIFIASIVMGIIAILANRLLLNRIGENIALIFSMGLGAVIYFALIYFAKIQEVDSLVKSVKEKFKL